MKARRLHRSSTWRTRGSRPETASATPRRSASSLRTGTRWVARSRSPRTKRSVRPADRPASPSWAGAEETISASARGVRRCQCSRGRCHVVDPPLHGARNRGHHPRGPALSAQWYGEVKNMADRIIDMRKRLRSRAPVLGSTLSWNPSPTRLACSASAARGRAGGQGARGAHIYMTEERTHLHGRRRLPRLAMLAKAIHEVTK